MKDHTTPEKIFYFPLTRMVIGIAVVAGSVALCEWARNLFTDKSQPVNDFENAIVGTAEVFMALLSYTLLFRFYEKRQITELSPASLPKKGLIGFLSGLLLQSLVILVIYLAGSYRILHINPFLFLVPGFIQSMVAGFVAEILIVGIFFRLTEEKLGTAIALIVASALFVIMHSAAKGATVLSVVSTAMQAGMLLPALYVFSRSLWLSIFFH